MAGDSAQPTEPAPESPKPAPETETGLTAPPLVSNIDGILTTEAPQIQINTDPNDNDAASDYFSDTNDDDLASLTSSVKNYVYENGRRYHAYREGKYVLPNDEEEKDRLDLMHHLCLLIMKGRLHHAPLDNPQRILDMGTGTGIWALDMADRFPDAEVIGNDLSPIQPEFVAPNSQFIIEDIEEEWAYPENHFDFVHGRTLLGSLKNWQEVFASAYKHIKPGGWFEMQEGSVACETDDNTLKPNGYIVQYMDLLHTSGRALGRDMTVHDKLGPWMIEAGFVNVHIDIIRAPWGLWPKDRRLKEIGKFQIAHHMQAITSYGLALATRVAGYTLEDAHKFLRNVEEEVKDRGLHGYNRMFIVYGQKPYHK